MQLPLERGSSEEKLQLAKSLGAANLINYKTTPDWAAEVLRLINGRGVDLVFEVGGAGTLYQSIKALRQGGSVSGWIRNSSGAGGGCDEPHQPGKDM
jgi:NADPH:quinone reductase-like Zn-dependent oxidoreductase